jgi:hypothetical protein
MSQVESLCAIANAVLYEGYMLYPYRPSALKNQRPGWSFGSLLPPSYVAANPGESASFLGEVLTSRIEAAEFTIAARFLQLTPENGSVERSVEMHTSLANLLDHCVETPFTFCTDAGEIQGCLKAGAEAVAEDMAKICLSLHNRSRAVKPLLNRDAALSQGMIAAHALIVVNGGEFISLLDPPRHLKELAGACRQNGVFPVLAGDSGARTAMLFSPIILYDYPQIAPESRGDFFDSSEIDELLTLRVLTLTDAEKQEVRIANSRAREVLERAETTTPEEAVKMHGVFRTATTKPQDLQHRGTEETEAAEKIG